MKRSCFVLLTATTLATSSVFAQNQPNMQDVMSAMGAMLGGSTNAAAVVDFRELKALLPTELDGMKRTGASGEKSAAMGMTVAVAEGKYSAEDGGNINIKIQDMGGTGAMMNFMSYGWASAEIDRETETGYERTATIGGHKAMEEYDSADQRGKTEILVNKRFLVTVTGYKVTAAQMSGAVGKTDLAKLATLQPKAPAPAP